MTMVRKKLSCKNCGYAYDAYPPDDVHTLANTQQCGVCKFVLFSNKSVTVTYDCENCNNLNKIYWHNPTGHSETEKRLALDEWLRSP